MTRVRAIAAMAMLAMFSIAPLLIAPAGAQKLSDRMKQVGMKIKCMCRGCEMPAANCTHPGGEFSGMCSTAKAMLKEVDQHVAKGETDEQILQAFVQEYGSQVYMEPPKSGFSLVAWALPSVYLFAGAGVVVFVIARWRKRSHLEALPPETPSTISPQLFQHPRARAPRHTRSCH